MSKNRVSALVPMKGNSERIPSKNTKILGEIPLFYHILRNLQSAKLVGEILVDTDSDKIKIFLKRDFPKVMIIDRPSELLGDKVPMTLIIEHDLKFIKSKHFLQTHATNPLLKPQTIDSAIEAYFDGLRRGFDAVMGVNKFQTRFYDKNKRPINHNPDIMLPSQDLPPIYEDNSTFYINSTENFYKHKNRAGKNPIFIEVSKLESIDVDEKEDFTLSEAVFYFLSNKKK